MAILVYNKLQPVPNAEVKINFAQVLKDLDWTAVFLDVPYNETEDPCNAIYNTMEELLSKYEIEESSLKMADLETEETINLQSQKTN